MLDRQRRLRSRWRTGRIFRVPCIGTRPVWGQQQPRDAVPPPAAAFQIVLLRLASLFDRSMFDHTHPRLPLFWLAEQRCFWSLELRDRLFLHLRRRRRCGWAALGRAAATLSTFWLATLALEGKPRRPGRRRRWPSKRGPGNIALRNQEIVAQSRVLEDKGMLAFPDFPHYWS